MSKSGSYSQRGGAGGSVSTTRCLNIGMSREIRSNRSTTASQSGERSSTMMVTIVERRLGSCSIAQANASLLRMKSAIDDPSLPACPHARTAGVAPQEAKVLSRVTRRDGGCSPS